jgi:acetate kinase
MKILVINSGSSSLKYRLFDTARRSVLAVGIAERIGEGEGILHRQWRGAEGGMEQSEHPVALRDHRAALTAIVAALQASGAADDLRQMAAIGHRVVHGGEVFRAPTLIDDQVVAAIRNLIPLAPLHNPSNLMGIELCREMFAGTPQVAVFDTAFHQTMPPRAYHYALPQEMYTQHHVRRYGFHGSSHAFVAKRAAQYLGRPLESLKLITLHLGNGASAAAVEHGRSIDTSMGMTPLEGLVMGTRSGDIDPALVFYLGRLSGKDPVALEHMLNEESGLIGLCGANDMREVLRRGAAGDERARLALDVYCYRIKKYIGAYYAALGGADALVFTAGVGENAAAVRGMACAGLESLGIRLDPRKNAAVIGEVGEIHAADAAVKILVIRTDEELEIAVRTEEVIARSLA